MSAPEPPTEAMEELTVSAPKGFAKRDALRKNEIEVQAMWEREKAFEADCSEKEKFLVTFPYPYSNGMLHIGHAFSLTKAVFRAQFERHQGKNVLFPFAFHCTGMPIQAVSIWHRRRWGCWSKLSRASHDSSELYSNLTPHFLCITGRQHAQERD